MEMESLGFLSTIRETIQEGTNDDDEDSEDLEPHSGQGRDDEGHLDHPPPTTATGGGSSRSRIGVEARHAVLEEEDVISDIQAPLPRTLSPPSPPPPVG